MPFRAERRRSRWREWVFALLREPVTWFFALATVVLGAQALSRGSGPSLLPPREELLVRLHAELAARNGREPTEEEIDAAWAEFLDREILYREALALGLDRDDEIVRRRLIQKMEFLLEGSAPSEPEEAELEAFFLRFQHRYSEPARASFIHVFLGEEEPAPEHVRSVRERLEAGEEPVQLSRPFLPGLQWRNRTIGEVETSFGSRFAQALPGLEPRVWSGPVESSFGWHLVRVEGLRPARIPPLAEVRARVVEDWRDEARRQTREEGLAKLRTKYARGEGKGE